MRERRYGQSRRSGADLTILCSSTVFCPKRVSGRRPACNLPAIGSSEITMSMGRNLILLAILWTGAAALAQVAPGAAEVAAYSGLHAAAWEGNAEPVAHADRNDLEARDEHGRTPLHVATFARQRDVIRALARAGADLGALDRDRYDAVTIAAVAGDEETLAVLLEAGAGTGLVTSPYDGTALIAAAHLGHDGVVRRLIAAGAPLDHVNNLHWTALIEAVVLGDGGPRHQSTVEALLDAGADASLTDRNGRTPLELARLYGHEDIATLLEAGGKR